ncbi:unnamed protein product [Cuscuta campestris]|uniref:Uncharacterized protein n=1 Tax=Cuscuta campestris TaxID=132261 RepID=A0A484LG96_9ASTE|nr:unnamed protein product [Cuscuta campestris]
MMLYMIIIIIILPLLSFFLLAKFRRKPYPPGPKGWPLIGYLNLMDHYSHRGLAKLADKYGGLVHSRMGSLHMVVVSGPEEARQVLQTHDGVLSNRPATVAISYLTYERADMAFAHYGPFWRQMRKVCVMKLFSRRRAESWDSVRAEVDQMVRTVAASAGSPVNVGELVFGLMKSVIYRAAFGSQSKEGQEDFISILQEFSKLFGAFNISDFFPWLKWADLQRLNPRLAEARARLDRFIDVIIDDHIQKRSNGGGNGEVSGDNAAAESDMVDELLAFYGEKAELNESSEDLVNAIKLTKDNIKAIIMDVMFGGTETVASAIEWAMAEVMKAPAELKKVQEELAAAVGFNRKVNESDLENLPYLKCCVKETLRLHPPIPLLLHEAAKSCVVNGYHIPAKSRVVINAWAIARDKNSWDDPHSFKPERFLKDGAPDFKGSHFEFVPFGSGRRSCPGMQLGLYALDMAVAQLLHCFTWELPDGMKPSELNMDDVFGLTAPLASRLIAVPTPRLLCPLN